MKKPTKNKEPETLEGFFESIAVKTKSNAAAGEALGNYLMSLVREVGILTTNLTEEVSSTLADLNREMDGKPSARPTTKAIRLGARAEALGWVAEQITEMVDKLKEEKNETIH